MKNKNLLASVAVFGELYNSEKYTGISSVIAEFIKAAVVYENKYCQSSLEITRLLEKVYDFKIPESVIRTVLITNLKAVVEVKKSAFHFNKSIESEYKGFSKEIEEKNKYQNLIFNDLIKYVSDKDKKVILDSEKEELFHNFNHFLFDNGALEKYSNHISAFIIQNENKTDFLNCLNSIREGLILYQGIKYTSDISDLGKWDTDLVIYLNTEYLFNALGYNGLLFKEIFDDFYKLVTEINSISVEQNKEAKISLRFFSETQNEIDDFFAMAESIKRGYKRLEPWRSAMKTIVNSCRNASDVEAKRVSFYLDLESLGIILEDIEFNAMEHPAFNVEDESVLEELNKISKERKKEFDKVACRQFFKIFNKINLLRIGNSKKPFEKIGHIFITESGLAKYLGHNNLVKFNDHDTSFAKDIDFVTSRFWFKLKKGFSEKNALPKSFDVLTKSRIILSSHINNSISNEYQKLVKETDDGKLTKDESLARSYSLREKPNKPEDITKINIDSTFDFLNNEDYFEEVYREKERKEELLKTTQKMNEELQAEINRRDELDRKKEFEEIQLNYNLRKESYINDNWKNTKKRNWKDLRWLIFVILLNIILVVSATILTSSTGLKNWVSEFGIFQIITIILYAIIIVFDVIGSKYLFNKDNFKNGWNWFIIIIRKKSYSQFELETKLYFNNEFTMKEN